MDKNNLWRASIEGEQPDLYDYWRQATLDKIKESATLLGGFPQAMSILGPYV
jgi:hypothetical protein